VENLQLGRDIGSDFEQAAAHEWLLTNGRGGFAAGTVAEANTRRYHGLLTAALTPPVGRTLLVAKIDVTACYRGRDWALFSNEFADGTVAPHGHRLLESFTLEDGLPIWRYALADAVVEKRLLMVADSDTTLLQLRVVRASAAVTFTLTPLCTYRDYHGHTTGGWTPQLEPLADGFALTAFAGARPYRVTCAGARYDHDPAWYWHFHHRVERERGLDDGEDLFRPGRLTLSLAENATAEIVVTADDAPAPPFADALAQQRRHAAQLTAFLPEESPDWIRQLALAADQFIVERRPAGATAGRTVIAGYPWFADWGRDTFIALTGLALVPRRFEAAAEILRTYAAHLSEGMLPNRFPDNSGAAEYNTVDASLWYLHAVQQYDRRAGEPALAAELYPVLREIIAAYRRGTRYGIGVDPDDGLLRAGEPGAQLTWMDAKVGDWVVTPRHGKPVEINALWYNALAFMATLAQRLGRDDDAVDFAAQAERVRIAFDRYWNPLHGYLCDVIDGPEGDTDSRGRTCDIRLRPNALFAVALPFSPLSLHRQKPVVDVCLRDLLTPRGLRSLAPGEAGYIPHYGGGPRERDGAYHQGTVWAWLIGPFTDAHYRVYGDAAKARSYLEPFALHLAEAGLGSISEIFDAEPPFTPRGCTAQAWSVAEVLRAWVDLTGHVPAPHNDQRS
jgi:predicted glycogen debranching enzyme